LENSAEQVLSGSKRVLGVKRGVEGAGRRGGPTMYTHVNKCINNKKGAKKKVKKGDNKNRNKNKRGKIFFKEN
jgi:hypothetical protein